MKHLLKLLDHSSDEIFEILDLADELKRLQKEGKEHHYLRGKSLGMIFQKSSTRTRVSFEVGMYQLGGQALFLSKNDLQIGRGEPVQDTARTLSRFLDGIMIRTYEQEEVENLAKFGSIPIINGLTDFAHPCQVLADLQTIREYKGGFEGRKLCFIGDGANNMANSLIVGCLKAGMDISIATPKDYMPDARVLDFAKAYGSKLCVTDDIFAAVKDADAVYTDVWASMGMEAEVEKRNAVFKKYQVNSEVMSAAKKDAIVLHCLPAKRGQEITDEVLEAHQKEIFDEAENRLHAQKAVMVKVMG